MTTNKSALITLGGLAAVLGAAVGTLAWRTRPSMSVPEPVQARIDAMPGITLEQGMTTKPAFGRFGSHMVIAKATSPAGTREELLADLRRIDDEIRSGAQEADMPEETSCLAILTSSTDPELTVTSADLHAPGDRDEQGTVSEVTALPVEEAAPVGGDAQPQDVSLPER